MNEKLEGVRKSLEDQSAQMCQLAKDFIDANDRTRAARCLSLANEINERTTSVEQFIKQLNVKQ